MSVDKNWLLSIGRHVIIVAMSFLAPGLVVVLAEAALAAQSGRPNVVLIMTDDQGYGDFGVMGNKAIKTPNIDAMAADGVLMETFYVSPVCSPTRACLMTGRYNYRTRCIDTFVGRSMMDPAEVTVAEMLRDAGYATGIFGKWHLGDHYPMRPMDQGFDEVLVHNGGGIGQPGDPVGGEGKYTDPVLFCNGKRVETKGYCTDVYFSAATAFIEKNCKQGKSFFVYIPTNAPHGPFDDVPTDLYEEYKKVDLQSVMLGKDNAKSMHDKADVMARIFAMITNVDDNVGRLLARLDALKIRDNTIVMFLTDNGPNTLRHVGRLRGMKGGVHSGGIQTPLFVHWPAQLKAGRKVPEMAAHIDVTPTILDACGVTKPAGVKFDGKSLWPLLKGEAVDWPVRTLFIQSHRGDVPVLYHHFAAITDRWKLVNPSGFGREQLPGPPEFELYDLAADPGERNNLAAGHPEIVTKLKAQYEAWFEDVGSTRPDNYAPPRIHIGTRHENPVVLTWQDWRHVSGAPWGPDSNGYWLLHVARAGKYDVRLRFGAVESACEAEMSMGGQKRTVDLAAGATGCLFSDVPLAVGDVRLETGLTCGGKTKGPHQVDVISK